VLYDYVLKCVFIVIYFINEQTVFFYREKEERQWRQWTDEVLVHTLSPNIYRTPSEAMQAFRYFSEAGEWTQTFGKYEQMLIVYCGAAAMFVIGRVLKKRYLRFMCSFLFLLFYGYSIIKKVLLYHGYSLRK
jgi:hypothetical protein